jgi:hypothetical protein
LGRAAPGRLRPSSRVMRDPTFRPVFATLGLVKTRPNIPASRFRQATSGRTSYSIAIIGGSFRRARETHLERTGITPTSLTHIRPRPTRSARGSHQWRSLPSNAPSLPGVWPTLLVLKPKRKLQLQLQRFSRSARRSQAARWSSLPGDGERGANQLLGEPYAGNPRVRSRAGALRNVAPLVLLQLIGPETRLDDAELNACRAVGG